VSKETYYSVNACLRWRDERVCKSVYTLDIVFIKPGFIFLFFYIGFI
jgi:hypothetical protein